MRGRYNVSGMTTHSAGRTGISALKKFFGTKDGQSLSDFAAEVKELDDEAFFQLRDGINDGSLTY